VVTSIAAGEEFMFRAQQVGACAVIRPRIAMTDKGYDSQAKASSARRVLRIPQTSETGTIAKALARRSSSMRSAPPDPSSSFFLAVKLASFAKVLVGPIPTEHGMPTHCRTVIAISWASGRRVPAPRR
jgi:hypothetical protein